MTTQPTPPMEKTNNILSTIALIIAVIIGTIYITREISADRSLKEKIKVLEQNKDSLDNAVKALIQNTNQKDQAILENIKTSYEQIDKLSQQKKDVHNAVEKQLVNVDSLINELLKEKATYEKP